MNIKLEKSINYFQSGNYKKSYENAKLAIKKFPNSPQSYTVAGLSLASMGKHLDAVKYFKKSLQIDPKNRDAKLNIAQSLILSERYNEARVLISRFLDDHKTDNDLLYLLAQCEYYSGNLAKAEYVISQTLQIKDRSTARNYSFRGVVRDSQGNLSGAIQDFETALEIQPQHIETLVKISLPLSRQLKTKQSIATLKTALDISPTHIGAWQQYGMRMLEIGDTEEAIKAFKTVLSISPSDGLATEQLSQIIDLSDVESIKSNCKRHLKTVGLGATTRSCLLFALAYIAKRQGDIKLEIEYLDAANSEVRTYLPYHRELEEEYEKNIYRLFPQEMIRADEKEEGPIPIYVVGLPRSGTTLTEAILGAHPKILALGERATTAFLLKDYLNDCATFDFEKIEKFKLGDKQSLPQLVGEMFGYVDKMPDNYRYIGYLKMVYPFCKIINITRDPRDIALSMWKAHFSSSSMNYCYDLEAMAHKFNIYARLMKHWHSILPEQILNISYKDLVSKNESTARSLSDFCNIDFDEKMLSHSENVDQVLTLSVGQIRQPVHTKSVGQWRLYESVLKPFIDALDYDLWQNHLTD